MASSGTIDGTRSGYNPYLRINWNIDQTDISGNRTRLRLRLYLMHPYAVYYSATKSGVLQGSSFSSTKNVSGTGNTLLRTQYIWVSHNSDGSKTQRLSASFNIAITFSGSRLNTLSVSGNAVLNSIPRGSTLSAFSFPSSFQPGTSNKINYTVKRHSGNYRHQLQLRDGSVTVAQWDNLDSSGSSSVTVSASQADSILNRMSSTTSKSFTLRLATRRSSGGGWIGNVDTRTATASVHSSVEPTIISTSAVPVGNSWAVDKGLYIQGQSGVRAEFRSKATGGARVRSRNISIGANNGGSVVGDVFRYTHSVFTGSGNVTITYKITDTRGRTTSTTRTINRLAYTPPRITTFEAVRGGSNDESITIRRIGTVNTLSGRNSANLKITETLGSGSSKEIQNINFTSNFDNTARSTVSASSSATYDIVVTDDLGNRASASVTIGTAFMEFSIRRGEGVGIGKIHEQGVLDIDGDVYSNGILYTVGGLGSISIPAGDDLNDYTANGFYHNRLNNATRQIANTPENNAFSLLVQKHAGVQQTFTTYGGNSGLIFRQYIRHLYSGSWGPWVIVSGNPTDNILWSGGWYMTDNHTATPSKPLSQCANGWMIQWSAYSGGVSNHNFSYTFIPKTHGAIHGGTGLHQIIGRQNYQHKTKYLYVSNTKITGSSNNSGDGIVMRRVYEW